MDGLMEEQRRPLPNAMIVCCKNQYSLFFQIYKNLYGAMIQGERALERPDWWQEFVDKPVVGRLRKSKL